MSHTCRCLLLSFSVVLPSFLVTNPSAAADAGSAKPAGILPWNKPDREPFTPLTSKQLDELVVQDLRGSQMAPPIEDEQFLRRASLDLIGRQPTPAELTEFLAEDEAHRRSAALDRLLDDDEFGVNWANYWSDVISYRTPQPELTFLDYGPLKTWLAEKLNGDATWDEITWHLLTATGKVKDNPAAAFVGFHQASPTRLTSEATRVFLGINLACAECHDHKFETWTQEDFHQLAAFFVRTEAKLPWNKSEEIVVSSKNKGEHKLPDKNTEMLPVLLSGDALPAGVSDLDRRTALARWLTGGRNEFFARAYVNRIWSRLMGRGFYEPVDHLSENESPRLPHVLAALEQYFAAGGFDIKELFRLVMNSEAYRRGLPQSDDRYVSPFVAAAPQ